MDYLNINKKAWNKRTEVHVKSEFYNVDGFLAGDSSLKEIELKELNNVSGQKLLHLQCHFGLDTLSWARRGAIVTGVDFSPAAISKANELKERANLSANFIGSDVYEYGIWVQPEFDIVFTSYGVINWLPSLEKWARTIFNSLKKGGIFYMVEFHPIFDLFCGYSYFHHEKPDLEEEGTYTENCHGEKSTLITWAHPLSDIINALIRAGIQIDSFNEFPYSRMPLRSSEILIPTQI